MEIRQGISLMALMALMAVSCTDTDQARDHEDIIREDLGEIIALQDAECGSVLSYSTDAPLNYRVTCESGHVYVIRVSPEGQVNVNSQK